MTADKAYLSLPMRRDEAALRAMLQRALPLAMRQVRGFSAPLDHVASNVSLDRIGTNSRILFIFYA
jgi:hypothetical protein